ncbi:hypothetical protein [uncultured Ruegeria sp.]|uniref:hypothetical protein n=1 Tax=uncultured Ruegeria sp. TaxID=259304 RepID=UPI0026138B43|nr:hypothetical protein [uncultured Ruegeria sp.]
MSEIERRKNYTTTQISKLLELINYSKSTLDTKGCIYLTGSFGRHEASEGSDIDAFIACAGRRDEQAINGLEEIRIKADLIVAAEKMRLPEFDGDGDYLRVFARNFLIESIGSQEDDYTNTFTARLLLLLEGKPLIGVNFFNELRSDIISSYWQDYEGHEENFVPAYFCNDVLRLWRTFCVNYEARTSEETAEKKSKRRAKNYKLRHTRIMTSFSALALFLLNEQRCKRNSPEFAESVFDLSPIDRIGELKSASVDGAQKVLELYERSLERSTEKGFKSKFIEDSYNFQRRLESRQFSEAFYEMLMNAGQGTVLIKRLLV